MKLSRRQSGGRLESCLGGCLEGCLRGCLEGSLEAVREVVSRLWSSGSLAALLRLSGALSGGQILSGDCIE